MDKPTLQPLARLRQKSPWILHYNSGGCNGCDIEILALIGPRYDIERFGILNRGNPKQADILLVTGPVTKRCKERLLRLYSQMPEPKVTVAVGSCACTGGVFRHLYHVENGVDQHIPVDVYIGGCAVRPEQIIDGVVRALDILAQKTRDLETPAGLNPQTADDGPTDRRTMVAADDQD